MKDNVKINDKFYPVKSYETYETPDYCNLYEVICSVQDDDHTGVYDICLEVNMSDGTSEVIAIK